MSPEEHAIRVLVIDERLELRRRITDLLDGPDVTVYDVGSPLGATSLVTKLHIDVLVVGAKLSSTTGRRVAQLVRNSPRLRHLKVVLVVEGLPDQLDRTREFADADAVLDVSAIDTGLAPTVARLTRRRTGQPSPRRTVLLVDSHDERRARFRASLETIGHTVEECARGTSALARALETKPKTIVVAVDLADLSALDVVELLRANPTAGAARILLFGDGGFADMEEARHRCGANGVLHAGAAGAELEDSLRSDSQTL